jgi:hypothetical protein
MSWMPINAYGYLKNQIVYLVHNFKFINELKWLNPAVAVGG